MNDSALPLTSAAPIVEPVPTPAVRPGPRVWPGVAILAFQWLAVTLTSWLAPASMAMFTAMFFGPMVGAGAVALWWLLASRVSWTDGILGIAVFVLGGAATAVLCHPSLRPMGLLLFALPIATTSWVGWLALTPFLRWPVRRVGLILTVLLAWSYFTLLRVEGIDGSMAATMNWRWNKTAEEEFLAEKDATAPTVVAKLEPTEVPLKLQPGDWPAFRGEARDGRLSGVRIDSDWKQHPPVPVWKHRIGPGWSSFTVVGDNLFTQEQRNNDEAVVCYDSATGTERWVQLDPGRFTEVIAGPGPRATPTFHDGKLYSVGASGHVQCLDARTGKQFWTRDLVVDTSATVPTWGFSSSPLVAHDLVIVFAGGKDGKSVQAYHADSGLPAWASGNGILSYCSPQLMVLDGVEQILIATEVGMTSYQPKSGEVLWQHEWEMPKGMARVVQPTVVDGDSVLLGTGFGLGTRRLHVTHTNNKWSEEAVWTSKAIKPYYNDLVIHDGHLYGFDNAFFTCVRLEDGHECWKERGYGNGQVLLLAEQGLLVILSEKGEVALVQAKPDRRTELARIPAIQGKTWNHPVIAHGKLFVRNGEEAACFQLTEEKKTVTVAK